MWRYLSPAIAVNAKLDPTNIMQITKEELMRAEIKAMMEMKGVEKKVNLNEKSLEFLQKLMMPKDYDCTPSGGICSGGGPPEECCSGSCVPHPILRIFVCA